MAGRGGPWAREVPRIGSRRQREDIVEKQPGHILRMAETGNCARRPEAVAVEVIGLGELDGAAVAEWRWTTRARWARSERQPAPAKRKARSASSSRRRTGLEKPDAVEHLAAVKRGYAGGAEDLFGFGKLGVGRSSSPMPRR